MAKTLAQKAAEKGLNVHTVRARIRYGWSEHKALNTPVRQNKAKAEDDLPKIVKPTSDDPMRKVDAFSDGFILTVAVLILGFVVFGLLWMAVK